MVPLRLLYSLAICAAGQLPFPVRGLNKSEEAPSTHQSESPKRARDEWTLEAVSSTQCEACYDPSATSVSEPRCPNRCVRVQEHASRAENHHR
jgi:hypothetical protein